MVMGHKQSHAAGLDEINNHAFHLVAKYRSICMDKQEFACLKAIALINSGRLLVELYVILSSIKIKLYSWICLNISFSSIAIICELYLFS